jgi:hypothetical protein
MILSQYVLASQDTETPDGFTVIYPSSTHLLPELSLPPVLFSYVQNRPSIIRWLLQRSDLVVSPIRFAMESSGSSSRNASADDQLTNAQAELLVLLDKLVRLIALDAMTNMQGLPEVCRRLQSEFVWKSYNESP